MLLHAGGSCPRTAPPSHPTAQSPRSGDPGVLAEMLLSRLTPPRPARRPRVRGHPLHRHGTCHGTLASSTSCTSARVKLRTLFRLDADYSIGFDEQLRQILTIVEHLIDVAVVVPHAGPERFSGKFCPDAVV